MKIIHKIKNINNNNKLIYLIWMKKKKVKK